MRSFRCAASYGLAVVCVAIAIFLRWLLDSFLGNNFELVTLFGAVAASVWFAGWRPALASALIGYSAVNYLFIPPRYEFRLDSSVLAGLAGFSLSCAVIIYLGERMRRARERLQREFAQRHRIEQTVEEREQQLRLITDAMPALISYIDRDQRYRFVNREYERWFGQPREAVIGKTVSEVLGDAAMQTLRTHVEAVLHGQDVRFEVETAYRDGGTRWIDAHYVPDLSGSGEVAGFFALVLDITERKRSEAALADVVRQQQLLYRFLEQRQAANSLQELYVAALDAIEEALRCDRASILLLDERQDMRFVAWRGLSDGYRKAVDGHTAWAPDDPEPQVVRVDDVAIAEMDESLKAIVKAEGIGALAFIPLVSKGRLIGKFMVYFDRTHSFTDEEVKISLSIARQIALGIERQRSEDALRESEARYRAVVESQVEMLCRFQRDGTILFVNDAYARARDAAPEALIRRNFWEFIDHRDRAAVEAMLAGLTPESPQVRIENRFATTEGYRWHLWTNRALKFDNAGRWVEAQSTGIDITERKQAEEALRANEQRFRLATSAGKLGIWDWDISANTLTWSDTLYGIHGVDPRTFRASVDAFSELIHPDDREYVKAAIRRTLESDARYELEFRVVRPEGRLMWIYTHATVLRDDSGAPIRMLGATADITERKRAEQALRYSEARFRNIFESVGVSIWEEDFTSVKAEIDLLAAAGVSDFRRYFAEHPEFVERAIDLVKIRDVNPATLRMFGARDRAEMLQSLKAVFVPESRTVFVEELITIAAKRQFLECETVVQTLAGEPLDVAFTVSFPAHDQPYDRVLVTVLDITERKRAGDILRQSEERFRLVANNSQILIWLTDGSGKLQFVNRAHRDFFGIGRDPSEFDWGQFIHPEDRQHYMEEFTTALRRRSSFQCRARMRRSDGKMRWIESRGNVISDSAGLRGYIGSCVDITDIYESEQKLREIDQRKDEFLANMSHEIRSPLTAIMGYADILLTKLKDSEDLAYVKTIKESGEYLIEIVNDILDLSKIEAGKLLLHVEPISLHSVLAEVQGLMSARAREKDLTLTLRYDGAVPETIETDRTRLRQILINLVSNAIKFTERGRIEIVVRWVHGNTESAGGTDGPAAAATVQFEVIDTGIGIAPEHKDILFQPFTQADTTTTRAYEGTGLGLTITQRLVEMLKGSVSFESELGKGSTFRVSIPTGTQQNFARYADGRSANAERSADDLTGQRVLVVDDRKEFCYLIGRYIERAGGRVESVWDGESAIRTAEAAEARDRFHAIIMDIQMPGIDGYETTRRLRARGFRVPIIALTAGAMVGDREKCLRAGCDDYLTKPIDREALISRVAYHAGRYARAKLRILLVDDSHNACTFLSGVLEKRGHEVRSAYYGESAISLVAEFRPDLFIIDICLPDMNGYDLMRRLKQLDGMGSAKFLGISGFGEEPRETAPDFDCFMEKPLDIQKLEQLLCSIAGSAVAGHAEN